MFYSPQSDPLPVRHRCRNARCGAKLKIPVANPRAAFCCRGCAQQFYRKHCLVCEVQFTRKATERRRVCWRSKCQYEFKHHPGSYFNDAYPIAEQRAKTAPPSPSTAPSDNASRSAHSTGLKSGTKSSRGYRVIAGPEVHEANLRVPSELPASKPDRAFREFIQRESAKAIFQRDTPPLNLIGGYRFPDAPKIDLSSPAPLAPPSESAGPPIDRGLDIPTFLDRRLWDRSES